MNLKFVVFYGSARSSRQGIRAARFVLAQCRGRGHEAERIEPLSHPLPILGSMHKEYGPGEAPPVLQRMADAIVPADGHSVVSGEYNHTVPPGLSNLRDDFLDEYFLKPSGIVSGSAGTFGGACAAPATRNRPAGPTRFPHGTVFGLR